MLSIERAQRIEFVCYTGSLSAVNLEEYFLLKNLLADSLGQRVDLHSCSCQGTLKAGYDFNGPVLSSESPSSWTIMVGL